MSQTRRLASLPERIAQVIADENLENSTNDLQNDLSYGSSVENEESFSFQDLMISPEFVEEQKLILLEIETAKLRIENEQRNSSQLQMQEVRNRHHNSSRRRSSSIGIRLNCPICLENLGSVRISYVKMVTECGHVFCKDCIEGVCKTTNEAGRESVDAEPLCPVCREAVGELRKVYF